MPSEVWSEITYPFPNFNGCSIEVWEWISVIAFRYLSLGYVFANPTTICMVDDILRNSATRSVISIFMHIIFFPRSECSQEQGPNLQCYGTVPVSMLGVAFNSSGRSRDRRGCHVGTGKFLVSRRIIEEPHESLTPIHAFCANKSLEARGVSI